MIGFSEILFAFLTFVQTFQTGVCTRSCWAHTRGIANKGFRGMRRSEVRFNFSCNLIANHPQSLTALTLDRWGTIIKKRGFALTNN